MENGKVKDVNLNNYQYIDHGYAVVEYKSQGGTWQNVIVHADTAKETTYNSQYVAQSRGKSDVQIYTNDTARVA